MAVEDSIGAVATISGEVTAQSQSGEVRVLASGDAIFQDDTVHTGDGSSVELRFTDGTVFSQGENSEVLLDVYVYNPAAGNAELLFNLAQGSLRAVSGEIVKLNPEGFNVETPLSTVGIRGTSFFVLLNEEGQVVGVEQMDPSHVVVVESDLGQMTIANAGSYVAVQLDGFLSDPTVFTPEFLQDVQQQIPMQHDQDDGGQDDGPDGGPDGGQDDGEDAGQDGGQAADPDAGQDAGLDGNQDHDGGDETVTGDATEQILDDLTDALQALQALGDSQETQDALDELADASHDGDGLTDTMEELTGLLTSLQDSLSGLQGQAGNLADDVLFGNVAEDIVSSLLDLKHLAIDTDGTAYSTQLGGQNYSMQVDTAGNACSPLQGQAGHQNALFGLDADDTIKGQELADILFGGTGNDDLNGQSGSDYLYGGEGDDTLAGGAGADYLVGGSGADKHFFGGDTATDAVRGFNSGEGDAIYLDTNVWTGFTPGGQPTIIDEIDNYDGATGCSYQCACLIWDSANDILYYDPDGNLSHNMTAIAHFEESVTEVQASDIHYA